MISKKLEKNDPEILSIVRRRRRAFSLFIIGSEKHEHLKFLTLTNLNDTWENLNNSWILFRKAVIYKYGDFQYAKIKTNEGNGVFHILMATKIFIPKDWIEKKWEKWTGAYITDIQDVKNQNQLVYYLSRYMSKQSSKTRIGSSRGWIYQGWRKEYDVDLTNRKREHITNGNSFVTNPFCYNACVKQFNTEYLPAYNLLWAKGIKKPVTQLMQ